MIMGFAICVTHSCAWSATTDSYILDKLSTESNPDMQHVLAACWSHCIGYASHHCSVHLMTPHVCNFETNQYQFCSNDYSAVQLYI
jgi:hypothetical protein